MADVLILDVGHGNCTIVHDGGATAVVDAPIGVAVIETLEKLGVTHVDHALISHSDADHLEGVLALLTSDRISVGSLYLNPDSEKTSSAWRNLLAAVRVAKTKGAFKTYPSLTTATAPLALGDLKMTVVSPSEALALSAVGGKSPDDKPNTANTLSAVIKVERTPDIGVLLAGDLDVTGLKDIVASSANLKASALVYPHHGGLPGADKAGEFTRELLELVGPDKVYVSNGRNKHANPRPEIVEAILDRGCGLACTQLAKACGDPSPASHLEDWPSAGRSAHHCCAGTVSLTLDENGAVRDADKESAFQAFVKDKVATAMCVRTKH
jgi:beta-lactamase superfamily II metal-dependent hydrolase